MGDSPHLVTGSVTGPVIGGLPQLKKIDLTSARSQEQLTVKPSVLSLYSPTWGGLPIWSHVQSQVHSWGMPQLKKIDLTSARSQEQLTVKPSVLSPIWSKVWLQVQLGGLPQSSHRFGHRSRFSSPHSHHIISHHT